MKPFSAETKLFGLLGHGASFSLSPVLHNYAAQALNKDLAYHYFDLAADDVANFLDIFWKIGGIGLNITMPHKNHVAHLVDSNGAESVNTLVRSDTGWKGYSTDGEGFLNGLARDGVKISDFDVVILLGSGGAAQAILNSIAIATASRPPTVIAHRRGKEQDQRLLRAFSVHESQILTLRSLSPEYVTDTLRQTKNSRRLLIQATSAPKNGDSLISYRSILNEMTRDDFLVDLIYDQPSDLYFSAVARDLRCQDGLPMLIEQARLSQKLWWGVAASHNELRDACRVPR